MLRLAKNSILPFSSRFSCRRYYAANDENVGSQEIPSKPKFVPCGGASFMQNLRNPTCDMISSGTEFGLGYRYEHVIYKALHIEGSKALEAGVNAEYLKYGIDAAFNEVRAYFKRTARMVHTPKEITQAATAAANGDTELGNFIGKCMAKVGKDALFIMSRNNKPNNEAEYVKAVKLVNWSFCSPFFITNKRKKTCLLKNPLVLVLVNKVLTKNVVQAVQQAMRRGRSTRPLLIICEAVEKAVEGSLMPDGSSPRKKLCVVKPPKYFIDRATWTLIMEDLAILTGGQVVTGESDMDSIPQMLGSCEQVAVSFESMFISGAAGDKKDIENRCKELRSAIKKKKKMSKSSFSLEQRLAHLSQAVMLKVGGASSYDRVYDVTYATQMARKLGIVPGGGVALLNASKELDKLPTTNSDAKLGVQVLQNALKMPVYSIASAAGFDGSIAVEKLLEQDNPNLEYDPASGEYIEMFKSGKFDLVYMLNDEIKLALRMFCAVDLKLVNGGGYYY